MSVENTRQGFTLLEMIVVILLMSILAITVLPKFFSSKGFEEHTYRMQIITALRGIHQQAMQQSSNSCHQVVVSSNRLAPPAGPTGCNCDPTLLSCFVVAVDSDHQVSFNSTSNFSFDSFGRPSVGAVTVTITGEQSLGVIIESEGYIHAAN